PSLSKAHAHHDKAPIKLLALVKESVRNPGHCVPSTHVICDPMPQRNNRVQCRGKGQRPRRPSGNYATIIGYSPEDNKTRIHLPSGAKKTISGSARVTVGIVAGDGRIDKPLLKAGRAYHKFKAKCNSRLVRVVLL
ncbi:hypothetical protein ID866_10883, partial [Astraeus odoratus]